MELKELKKHKRNIQRDINKLEQELGKAKTNHILHFLISILSLGIWVFMWLLISISTATHRAKLEKNLEINQEALMEIEDLLDDPEVIESGEVKSSSFEEIKNKLDKQEDTTPKKALLPEIENQDTGPSPWK